MMHKICWLDLLTQRSALSDFRVNDRKILFYEFGFCWKFLSSSFRGRFYHYKLRLMLLPSSEWLVSASKKFTITITLGKFNFFIFARVKNPEKWKKFAPAAEEWNVLKEIIVKRWKACAFMFHQNKHIKEERYPDRLRECIITWCGLSGRFQNIPQLTFLSLSRPRCLPLLLIASFHSLLLRWNHLSTQSRCSLCLFYFTFLLLWTRISFHLSLVSSPNRSRENSTVLLFPSHFGGSLISKTFPNFSFPRSFNAIKGRAGLKTHVSRS